MWPQASARRSSTGSAITFHQLSSSTLKLEHVPSVFSSWTFPWINSPQSCFEMLGNSTSPRPEWSATTAWPQTISGTEVTGSAFSRWPIQRWASRRKNISGVGTDVANLRLTPQVGSSVKEYHTYTWALVPEGHTDGNSSNCCVVFQGRFQTKNHTPVCSSISVRTLNGKMH